MFVKSFVLVSSPFYQAYVQSDYLGKLIFFALIATSICSWSIFIHKIILTKRVRVHSHQFGKFFGKHKNTPLNLEAIKQKTDNPFYDLWVILKKSTLEMLNKNHQFGSADKDVSYLSEADVESIASHLVSHIDFQIKNLEKNLFILSTIVGLAPLLGLLGTVWGILTTFSELQSHAVASTNQMMLGGISLALTTTVLGLMSAIPALIAYNYLKNSIRDFETEMEGFSNEMLFSVEMQYRKVDIYR